MAHEGGIRAARTAFRTGTRRTRSGVGTRDGSGLVFPSSLRNGREMSDGTLTKLLRTTGPVGRATGHGFRSSFQDWAGECTDSHHAVMKLSPEHHVGKSVEQAYARSDVPAKCRRLVDEWGAVVVCGT